MPKAEKTTRASKAAKEKPAKAPRAKKDKNAPKKALSAYLIFANENRARVRAANPDASFGQVGKLLGQEWKEISEAEKQKYVALQEKDKARYTKAMADYKGAEAAADAEEEEEEAGGDEEDDE
ncbi:Non-histone chromosomal protein 6 [Entophlyctis luteolus]|nr:Non-histone chromosomal protein 6 [Entophlyctis luteolus]KAJ3354179.1 Non-histone chromosomal protein 6 [Entophlyctis luteolus]KAJ3392696.1 Non-histone chromosomal protein 6 [Entophlyctis sp. JEL0112]